MLRANPLTTGATVAMRVYRRSDLPKPGGERMRPTLSLFGGATPTDGQPVEIVVESFVYTP